MRLSHGAGDRDRGPGTGGLETGKRCLGTGGSGIPAVPQQRDPEPRHPGAAPPLLRGWSYPSPAAPAPTPPVPDGGYRPAALTSLRGSRASVCRNLDALKRFMVLRSHRAAPGTPPPPPPPAPPRDTPSLSPAPPRWTRLPPPVVPGLSPAQGGVPAR